METSPLVNVAVLTPVPLRIYRSSTNNTYTEGSVSGVVYSIAWGQDWASQPLNNRYVGAAATLTHGLETVA